MLLDISQTFLAARANKVVLNYAKLLSGLQGSCGPGKITGLTTFDPRNSKQTRFIEMLQDMGVEVLPYPAQRDPVFTIELAMLAAGSAASGEIVFVAGDSLLQRAIPLLKSPVTIAFFPSHMDSSWLPLFAAGKVRFVDLNSPAWRMTG